MIKAIIQARLGSTRLPGKVMMQLGSMSALEQCVRRVQKAEIPVTVAVPHEELWDWKQIGIGLDIPGVEWLAGPEEDVLARYVMALGDAEEVVRVTSDCPLADYQLITAAIRRHRDAGNDFTFYVGNIHGIQVEVFTRAALLMADRNAADPSHREHVSDWIIEEGSSHGLQVGVTPLPPYEGDSRVRLTLDTSADYKLLSEIFEIFGDNAETEEVVAWVRNQQHS